MTNAHRMNALRGDPSPAVPQRDESANTATVRVTPWRTIRRATFALVGVGVLVGGGFALVNDPALLDKALSSVGVSAETQYRVVGDSMEPALHDGQVLRFPKEGSSVVRGEVAVVDMPLSWQYAGGASGTVVKRVAATEGDSVSVVAGALHINGVQKTGVNPSCKTSADYSYVLKSGEVFFMGDNQGHSFDSLAMLCLVERPEAKNFTVPVVNVKAHSANPLVKDRA